MLDVGVLLYDFPNLRYKVLDKEGAEVPGPHFVAPGTGPYPAFVKPVNGVSKLLPVVILIDCGTYKHGVMCAADHPGTRRPQLPCGGVNICLN